MITRLGACDGVDLWLVALDEPIDEGVLAADERHRAANCRDPARAARMRASRAGLRHVLAAYVGILPARLEFTRSRSGAPVLAADPDCRFSLSRSADLCVVAVGPHRRVGIDVERTSIESASCAAIAEHCLDASERERYPVLDPGERRRHVLEAWTRREAALKAMDRGLLDHRTPGPDTTGPAALAAAGWRLDRPDIGLDRVVALVSEPRRVSRPAGVA